MKSTNDTTNYSERDSLLPADLTGQFQLLLTHLVRERDRYRKGSIGKKRTAAGMALLAVIDFIESFDLFKAEGLTEPLEGLSEALYDVFGGKPRPLVAVHPLPHRPPDSLAMIRLKVWSAVCMDLLMRSGKRRDEAARIVAQRLNNIHVKKPGRGDRSAISAGTVKEWRDHLTGPDDPDSPSFARQRFRLSVANSDAIKASLGIDFGKQAMNALAGLPEMLGGVSEKGAS